MSYQHVYTNPYRYPRYSYGFRTPQGPRNLHVCSGAKQSREVEAMVLSDRLKVRDAKARTRQFLKDQLAIEREEARIANGGKRPYRKKEGVARWAASGAGPAQDSTAEES